MSDLEERLAAIHASPTYCLAEDDLAFMESDAARAERLALEFMRTDLYLRAQRIASTVVVFGSARILSPEQARRALDELERATPPKSPEILRRARKALEYSRYYEEARIFARLVSENAPQGPMHELAIVTGGGPGIMEAANRGACEANAPSIGFNIRMGIPQGPNPYLTPNLAFSFHYFALRKMHFLLRARALVAFPGGYGTLDELFESLNLIQTRTIDPIPIVLVGREHWERAVRLDYLLEEGFIDERDRSLVTVFDSGEEAARYILKVCTDKPLNA